MGAPLMATEETELRNMPREEMLERLSFLCARRITAFGDLTPMEIEALLRGGWGMVNERLCGVCGSPTVPPDAEWCVGCGARQPASSERPQEQP